jgi:hypothetical protein
MKKINTFGVVIAVLGVLIILTPIVFPVCEGLLELVNGKKVPMRCNWTAQAEWIIGALVFISGLLVAFAKSAETRKRLNNQVFFLGLATILTPLFIIPTCMNPDMACNVGTKPALIILGVVVTGLGLYGSFLPRSSAVTAAGE